MLNNRKNNLSEPIKASFWFMVCGVLQRGISVITTPIFTRLMSTSEYGVYSLFNSWQSILCVFVTLNLSAGVFTRGVVKNEDDIENFTSSFLGLSVLLTLVSTVVYVLFSPFFNRLFNMNTVLMLCMLITMFNNTLFGFWSTRQRVDYKYKALIAITLITSILQPLLGIVGMYLFPLAKVEARVISATFVGIVFYWGLALVQIKRSPKVYSSKYWKYALRFNIPLIPHYLSQSVLSSSDRIMIGKLCSESDAGIYSLAYSLAMLMTIVNTAITNTFSPWLYKSIQHKQYKNIGSASYFLLIMVAIVNLILIAFAPEIIAIFAPKEYADAVWAIPPVAMTVFFIFMYTMFANFSFYYEKTKTIALTSCLGAVLNVILNAICIPVFGYVAAAYTTLICYICYSIGHYRLMRKISKEYMDGAKIYDCKILIGLSVALILIGHSIMFIYSYPVIRYFCVLLIALVGVVGRKKIVWICKKLKDS